MLPVFVGVLHKTHQVYQINQNLALSLYLVCKHYEKLSFFQTFQLNSEAEPRGIASD
jgi:hypothetical protein